MSNLPKKFASKNYEGIILDLLDDILKAESAAKTLVDKIDMISYRPSIRLLDVDAYLRALSGILIAMFLAGVFCGFGLHFYLSRP